jgi:hypothetical protein
MDPKENGAMLDIIMLAIGLGFFALVALYGIVWRGGSFWTEPRPGK